MTQMGIILGTAAYMAPEQAKGKPVDKRADIWAFGVVLLRDADGPAPVRRRHHSGDPGPRDDPCRRSPRAARDDAPRVRDLLARCLEKDPKARLRDIGEARLILGQPAALGPLTAAAGAAPILEPQPRRRTSAVLVLTTAVSVLAALAAGAGWYRATSAVGQVTRFVIPSQDDLMFTAGSRVGASVPVISPDGRSVAFTARDSAGRQLLWIRRLDAIAAEPLAGTEHAAYPFWSPDSRWLAYAVTGKMMRVPVTGGSPQTVCDLSPGIISRGGSWNEDDVLIFNNGPAPLYRAPAGGGEAVAIGTLAEGEGGRQFPAFLPDGRHFLSLRRFARNRRWRLRRLARRRARHPRGVGRDRGRLRPVEPPPAVRPPRHAARASVRSEDVRGLG